MGIHSNMISTTIQQTDMSNYITLQRTDNIERAADKKMQKLLFNTFTKYFYETKTQQVLMS